MLNEKTTFTLTLNRLVVIIIAIVGTAFTFGVTYQQIVPDRDLQKKQTQEIEDIKLKMSRMTALLENMEKNQQETTRDISALQNKISSLNAEVQLMTVYIKERNRRDDRD